MSSKSLKPEQIQPEDIREVERDDITVSDGTRTVVGQLVITEGDEEELTLQNFLDNVRELINRAHSEPPYVQEIKRQHRGEVVLVNTSTEEVVVSAPNDHELAHRLISEDYDPENTILLHC